MQKLVEFTPGTFSPNHADPPLYNSGHGTVWEFGIILDNDGNVINDKLPEPEPVHWRSRGRHDPGDGEYTNRWAFAPERDECNAHLPPRISTMRYVVASHSTFDWRRDYNPSSSYRECFEQWDAYSRVFVRIEPRYGDWVVRCSAQWIDTEHIRVYSSYALVTYRYVDFTDGTQYAARDDAVARAAELFALLASCSYSRPYPSYSTYSNYYCPARNADDLVIDAAPARLSDTLFVESTKMLPHTHIGTLEAEAYRRAVDQLPHAGMNNIANIAETISLISNMLFSGGLTSVGTIEDAWLAYRYSYSTTKSDIEELAKLIVRLDNLTKISNITTRGTVYDGEFVVKCSITLFSTELNSLHKWCEKWGLALKSYNVWDMIPYSFIVDWFLDVGGALERGESIEYAYRCKKAAWFSIERRWTNEYGCREIYYHRHFATPNLSEAYLYRTVDDPSGVTVVKRVTDALAIVR